MSLKTGEILQAVGAGFIALWLYDVITSNLAGHRVLHQAGTAAPTTGQICVNCTASTTTPGSFDCTTCAAAGTVGAPQFGCSTCTASTTVPGSFDCMGCEGYTCATCTPGATPNSFTCTTCVDALTAATTPAAVPPATDPCSAVTSTCIFDAATGGCVREGNSACTCSGCSMPSASSPSCTCIFDIAHQTCLCQGTTNPCSGCSGAPGTPGVIPGLPAGCLQGDPRCDPSAKDPCTRVTSNCVYDAAKKGCVRSGNSACKCSGCTNPSVPVSIPKAKTAAPAAKPTLTPRLAPFVPKPTPVSIPKPAPKKICPPLVAC